MYMLLWGYICVCVCLCVCVCEYIYILYNNNNNNNNNNNTNDIYKGYTQRVYTLCKVCIEVLIVRYVVHPHMHSCVCSSKDTTFL